MLNGESVVHRKTALKISSFITVTMATAIWALASCGPPPVIERALELPPECRLISPVSHTPDTITVALADAVDPQYAPWAHNAGEQLLFHHLYETLITVDCLDKVRPRLAGSWKREHGGRRWLFELRQGARFWDGSAVTAEDVVNSWRDAVTLYAFIDSVKAVDTRRICVYLSRRHRDVPRELSAPAFGVATKKPGRPWPLGTGAYQVTTRRRNPHSVPAQPFGGGDPTLLFQTVSRRDARELLENTIDVMVTSHPRTIEYATTRPQLATMPLPWDRAYVLLSSSRVGALRGDMDVGRISRLFMERLAQDAVRGDARATESPWWDDVASCSVAQDSDTPLPRSIFSSTGLRRIMYDAADPNARDIAERIIALAVTDPDLSEDAAAITEAIPDLNDSDSGLIARGVAAGELELSLRQGDDYAYIVTLPLHPADACYEAARLHERAPWLAAPDVTLGQSIIPLVDARAYVIARRDKLGLIVDWYSNVLIVSGK
jgi:hypothetical protein